MPATLNVSVSNHTFQHVTVQNMGGVFRTGTKTQVSPNAVASILFKPRISMVKRFFGKRSSTIDLDISGGYCERLRIDCDKKPVEVLETAHYLIEIVKGSYGDLGESQIEVAIHDAHECALDLVRDASSDFIQSGPYICREPREDLDSVSEPQGASSSKVPGFGERVAGCILFPESEVQSSSMRDTKHTPMNTRTSCIEHSDGRSQGWHPRQNIVMESSSEPLLASADRLHALVIGVPLSPQKPTQSNIRRARSCASIATPAADISVLRLDTSVLDFSSPPHTWCVERRGSNSSSGSSKILHRDDLLRKITSTRCGSGPFGSPRRETRRQTE